MNCIRCELLRAKLMVLVMRGFDDGIEAIMTELNKLRGHYFTRHEWSKEEGLRVTILRRNDNPEAGHIEITSWLEPERNLNKQTQSS